MDLKTLAIELLCRRWAPLLVLPALAGCATVAHEPAAALSPEGKVPRFEAACAQFAIVHGSMQGMTACADLADRYRARNAHLTPAKVPDAGTIEVPLERLGGAFVLPATLNGTTTLTFLLDSGATDVVLPKSIAAELAQNGSLAPQDYVGDGVGVLADGSAVPESHFLLHSITVGGQTVTNVECSVGADGGPALLGQSFLQRFPSWSVDNARGVLVLQS